MSLKCKLTFKQSEVLFEGRQRQKYISGIYTFTTVKGQTVFLQTTNLLIGFRDTLQIWSNVSKQGRATQTGV